MVKIVGSLVEFEAELKSAGEKLIVVDFSATWCGPCKMIKPFFHSLCEKYGDVVFIEIDVDDAQDVASHCDVKCMPTFQFYKNGKKRGCITFEVKVLSLLRTEQTSCVYQEMDEMGCRSCSDSTVGCLVVCIALCLNLLS